MTTLVHEGYVATVTIDPDAGVLHGEVVNTRAVLTFSVTSAADLKKEFAATIDDYRSWCAELGEQPEKPYSGTVSLRMAPEMHRAVSVCSAKRGISLNNLVVEFIRQGLKQEGDAEAQPAVVETLRDVAQVLRWQAGMTSRGPYAQRVPAARFEVLNLSLSEMDLDQSDSEPTRMQ